MNKGMSEDNLKDELLANVPAHWSNIETGLTCAGFPDLHYTIENGDEGLIELKCWPWPKKRKQVIRPSQIGWWRERERTGGKVLLLAVVNFDNGFHYVVYTNFNQIKSISQTNDYNKIVACATQRWTPKMDWEEFKTIYMIDADRYYARSTFADLDSLR